MRSGCHLMGNVPFPELNLRFSMLENFQCCYVRLGGRYTAGLLLTFYLYNTELVNDRSKILSPGEEVEAFSINWRVREHEGVEEFNSAKFLWCRVQTVDLGRCGVGLVSWTTAQAPPRVLKSSLSTGTCFSSMGGRGENGLGYCVTTIYYGFLANNWMKRGEKIVLITGKSIINVFTAFKAKCQ